jgi:hypothetical protein
MSWRDSTIIASVSAYHRGSYAERYSRFNALRFIEHVHAQGCGEADLKPFGVQLMLGEGIRLPAIVIEHSCQGHILLDHLLPFVRPMANGPELLPFLGTGGNGG